MEAYTIYKIIYEVGGQTRIMNIKAASSFLAFKEFKKLVSKITFDNLLINEIIGVQTKKRKRLHGLSF